MHYQQLVVIIQVQISFIIKNKKNSNLEHNFKMIK